MDPTVRSVLRWTLLALAVSFAALVASGLWLVWNYVPADPALFSDLGHAQQSVEWAGRVRWVHHWTAQLAVLLAIAVLVEAVLGAVRHGRWRTAVAALAAPFVALAGAFTGHLIAWDQLGMWAVRIGEDLRGYRVVLDDDFRFAVVGSSRVDTGTFSAWFWIHVVVVPLLGVAALVTVFVLIARSRRGAIASSADT